MKVAEKYLGPLIRERGEHAEGLPLTTQTVYRWCGEHARYLISWCRRNGHGDVLEPELRGTMGAVRFVITADSSGSVVVVALLLLAGAGVAAADAPFRLADRVTDRAGVLDPAGKTRVQQAVDRLRAEKGYDLFVVYVRSFDGAQPQEWAERTGQLSQLGRNDVLLAVATQDRAYYVSYAQDFPLSQQTTDAIADKDVEPRLGADDWSGAAVGLADGLRSGRARVVRRRWGSGSAGWSSAAWRWPGSVVIC